MGANIDQAALAPSAPASPPLLAASTASGFLWLMAQSLSGRFATFFSQLILAKLLLPEAFGQIGLAYTVTTLVGAFVSFGIDDVLLQRLRRINYWVAPAFIISLGLALLGMVVMLAVAPIVARLYGSTGLVGLLVVLAINLPISALAVVPGVKLRAAMNFRFLASYASIEIFAIQAASVALAASGFGAYSFVLPVPAAAAIRVAVFWWKAPTRLQSRWRRVQFRFLLGSGLLVLGTRLLIEAVNQGDYIVLGVMATDAVVGMYFFAFRLAAQPVRMLAGNFGSVLFPALVQLRAEPQRQEAAVLRVSQLLAYMVTPLCFLQAAVAAPLLHLMFGVRWDGAIPLIQILSLGLPGDAVAWIAGALLVARREFRRDFVYLAATAPPFFLLVIAGAYWGSSLGVAIGVSLYYATVKPLNSWWVLRHTMRLADFGHIYVWPAVLSALAIGSVYVAGNRLWDADRFVPELVLNLILGPSIYLILMQLFVPHVLREVVARFSLGRLLKRFGW